MLRIQKRRLFLTHHLAALREPIIYKVDPEKPKPRYHAPPTVAADIISGMETAVGKTVKNSTPVGKIKCPWCKHATVAGNPAIICPVWPGHNWTYGANIIPRSGAVPHKGVFERYKNIDSRVSWNHSRVVDTRRMPPDVFYPDRYFNQKDYLNAVDPFRQTTPIGHKIPKWVKKYGTKQTLKYDKNGEKISLLSGHEFPTWINGDNYLENDDGKTVVYVTGTHDEASGSGVFWGPGNYQCEPIPSTDPDENTEAIAQAHSIFLAIDLALKMNLRALEIRADFPPPDDFEKLENIEINFVQISDRNDLAFQEAEKLAFDAVLNHIGVLKRAANRA